MLRNIMFILLSITFIVSCSNLDNQHDRAQLVCGETKDLPYAWLYIESSEAFSAILVKDGDVKSATQTAKSCITIGPDDRDSQLLVRDSATQKLSLRLELKVIPPGLSRFSLVNSDGNQRPSTQVRCSETEMYASDKLELFFKRTPVDVISYPMVEIKIFDLQRNPLLHKTLVLGDSVPALPLDLSEGQYTIEMRNFDAFDPQSLAVATPESCSLIIDKSLPNTQLKDKGFTPVEGITNALKVPPGASLEFASDQEPGHKVYICLKQRKDENVQVETCNMDEFINAGSNLNAPESGAWDLYAFSKDKAGNTSALSHSILYVYHDALIAEIRALSKTVQLLIEARKSFEAFKNFQKLLSAGKKLALKMEIRDIYWPLLIHFEWAANKNSAVWAQNINNKLSVESVAVSPYEDAWAVSTNSSNAGSYIFKNGNLSQTKTSYHEFKFLDKKRMVGIRSVVSNETILDLYENNNLIESRTFKNFYEDVEIDMKQGVFVLLSLSDIVLIDFNNFDKQRVIPLPEAVKYAQHPGLEFLISSDFQYYYISFAEYILRIHLNSGTVAIYKDSNGCWIRKPDIAPTGELYYANYRGWTTIKDCRQAYQIDWKEDIPHALIISPADKAYDSVAIVDIDTSPFLVSSWQGNLEFRDLRKILPDETLSFGGKTGFLKRHPMYRDVLYLETERSIYLVSLNLKNPTILLSREFKPPGNEANRVYFPTRDPSKILIVDNSEIQIHSFRPERLGIMEEVSAGNICIKAQNKKYSLCKQDDNIFYWGDHDTIQQKRIAPLAEIQGWEILTDGEVIFVTANRELLSWKPESETIQKFGEIELEGKVTVSWHPFAQVLAVHHAVNWYEFALYPERYKGTLPPKTLLYTRKSDQWVKASTPAEGVPLPFNSLPVVLIVRATPHSAYIDVINQDALVINTLKSCSFQNLDLQNHYISALTSTFSRVRASGFDRYLYSTCSRTLRKFDLYDGTEHDTFKVPDGYQVETFYDDPWLWLLDASGDRGWIMNFRTGLTGDYLGETIWGLMSDVEWKDINYNHISDVFIDHSGLRFNIDLRSFFHTPNEFIVGHTFTYDGLTKNHMIKIDPHWMDAQLKKSPLYHLERNELPP